MASSFKNATVAVGTSNTTIYTAPSSPTIKSAVVHGLFFANTDGTATVNVTLQLVDTSSSISRNILYEVPVPPNTTLSVDKPINLEPQDVIRASASSANLDCVASILELS